MKISATVYYSILSVLRYVVAYSCDYFTDSMCGDVVSPTYTGFTSSFG